MLSAGTRVLAALRPSAKPLHPTGRVQVARLCRCPSRPSTGVEFLDGPEVESVLVRESRAVGLPRPLPDIHGLALRATNADGSHGDVLLATTGWGPLSRFVLTPSRTPYARPMTTLLPYRTALGPVLLGARGDDRTRTVDLYFTVGAGHWTHFAELRISEEVAADPVVSFDPVMNPVAGVEQYPAVDRLREPAYRAARQTRDHDCAEPTLRR